MSTLHAQLVQTLRDGLGLGYTVLDFPTGTDAPTGRTVNVWTTTLAPGEGAMAGRFQVDYVLELTTRYTDPTMAEADLGASLADVLDVLWRSETYVLTKADRMTNEARTLHTWQLTVVGGLEITPED